jgi:predicted ribosome quality control (RQC) complex YloA/Tae2 family protein
MEMCDITEADIACGEIKRLGKIPVDPTQNPRQFLIKLRDSQTKQRFLRNCHMMKKAGKPYDKIAVQHDLTIQQRAEEKRLSEQAKEMESKASGNYIFRVRGPPWDRKTKEITKKLQKATPEQPDVEAPSEGNPGNIS